MITLRRSRERGHFDHGWLKTYHTFSFDQYYDPAHMHFRNLRVINEDLIHPGAGFPSHPHRDMEIVTYVLDGELTHCDSMGHEAVLRQHDVQAMTAGAGITHSEGNRSRDRAAHLLQIWILPRTRGLTPRYEDKTIAESDKRGRWRLIVSPDGRDDSLPISQDVSIYASVIPAGTTLDKTLAVDRHAWVQVARGAVDLNGAALGQGDGAAVSDERRLSLTANEDSEILLFDLD